MYVPGENAPIEAIMSPKTRQEAIGVAVPKEIQKPNGHAFASLLSFGEEAIPKNYYGTLAKEFNGRVSTDAFHQIRSYHVARQEAIGSDFTMTQRLT